MILAKPITKTDKRASPVLNPYQLLIQQAFLHLHSNRIKNIHGCSGKDLKLATIAFLNILKTARKVVLSGFQA
jgi:hypothetical protein